jgi:hypothetical protein
LAASRVTPPAFGLFDLLPSLSAAAASPGSSFGALRHLSLPGMTLSHQQLLALEAVPALASLDVTDTVCAHWQECGAPAPPRFAGALASLACSGGSLAARWRRAGAVFGSLAEATLSALDYSCLTFFWPRALPSNNDNNSNGSNAAASGAAPPPRFAPLRLRRLALVGTRVCALRGPAWRALTSELTSLTLTNCDLRPRPMLVQRDYQVVADVLASARGLRELRLDCNAAGEACGEALVRSGASAQLRRLDASNLPGGAAGLPATRIARQWGKIERQQPFTRT